MSATKNDVLDQSMHKFKHRSGELFVKNMFLLQHHFAMLDLETAN